MNSQTPLLLDITSLVKTAILSPSSDKPLSRQVLGKVRGTLKKYPTDNAVAFISKQSFDDESIAFEIEIIESVTQDLGVSVVKPQEKNLSALIKRCARDNGGLILTSNKSLYQLIDDTTSVVDPVTTEVINGANIVEKIGVSPSQIPDYIALKGNPEEGQSQSVSIGDKLIHDLFAKYSSLEDILSSKEIMGHKILRKLSRFSENLMGVKSQVHLPDINFNISTINPQRLEPNKDQLLKLYKRYNFNDWILKDGLGGMRVVQSEKDLNNAVKKLSTERGILIKPLFKENNLVSVGISTRGNEVYVFQLSDLDEKSAFGPKEFYDAFKPLFEDDQVGKVVLDAKSFTKNCMSHGIRLSGLKLDPVQALYNTDTGLHASKSKYDIESLNTFLGEQFVDASSKMILENPLYRINTTELSMALATESIELFGMAVETYRKMKSEYPAAEDYYSNYEVKINEILASMELEGIHMDAEMLEELKRRTEIGQNKVDSFVQKAAKTDEKVNQGLFKKLIYDQYKLIPVSTGKHSVKKEVLESCDNAQHPLIKATLEWSKLNQILININKFSKNIDPKTGNVHPVFNHMRIKTGRFSAQEPPVQGFPKKGESIALRNSVKASKGNVIVSIDYSQFELKILAQLSQDPVLIEAFRQGVDIHKQTASQMFETPLEQVTEEQRKNAKAINFGLIYGKGPKSLANDLGVDINEAKRLLNKYFEQFPKVSQLLNSIEADVRNPSKGFIQTFLGRKITLKDANSDVNAAVRAGKNAPMQGSAAELMKIAMVDMHELIQAKYKGSRIINQIHDELLFEVPKEQVREFCAEAKFTMENIVDMDVPLSVDVEVGKSWGLAKPYSVEKELNNEESLEIA